MTTNLGDPAQLGGTQVMGSGGEKLGKVDEVYLDNASGNPEWVSVKTGMFGGDASLVPLSGASFDGDQLQVPYSKDQMKDAPHHDPGQALSEQDETDLYRHYGMDYGTNGGGTDHMDTGVSDQAQFSDQRAEGAVGRDTSGPTTDDAMTRSEEQLRVGTETRETGRARLRKYVTTEEVSQTVPVSHEEVRLEREPITDHNRDAAMSGGEITEEEHEVTLNAERPVVAKETVAKERVRLSKETVQGEETVSDTVRKEHIDDPEHIEHTDR